MILILRIDEYKMYFDVIIKYTFRFNKQLRSKAVTSKLEAKAVTHFLSQTIKL